MSVAKTRIKVNHRGATSRANKQTAPKKKKTKSEKRRIRKRTRETQSASNKRVEKVYRPRLVWYNQFRQVQTLWSE